MTINKNLKVVYQIDPNLITNINKFGCRFMSMLAIPQYYLNKVLSTDQILKIYDECVAMGPDVMAKDCSCGPKEHLIMTKGFETLGNKKNYCVQLMVSDAANSYKSANMLPGPNNPIFFIFDLVTSSSAEYGGHHFILCDNHGRLLYDPANGTCDASVKKIGRWLYYKIYDR